MAKKKAKQNKGGAPKGNKNAVGNTGGRPPKFTDPDEMERLIDEYFLKFEVEETGKNPTFTGLILHMGLVSKTSFYDYGKKVEFAKPIKRARLLIEQVYEDLLQGHKPTGAIFALKNMDWADKQQIDNTHQIKKQIFKIGDTEIVFD